MNINIVLHQPEIPPNTGNIGRLCAATGAKLHLIHPLGFDISEKAVKKAGMDYWDKISVFEYSSFEDFVEKNNNPKIYMATTKALHTYDEVSYGDSAFIMFGRESAGIPEEILKDYRDTCIRIPMLPDIRSINLATSVAVVLYDVCRQNKFDGLENTGNLHNSDW